MLLQLPDELLLLLLRHWIKDLRDISNLDVAVTHSKTREVFLRCLQHPDLQFDFNLSNEAKINWKLSNTASQAVCFLQWLTKRKANVASFTLDVSLVKDIADDAQIAPLPSIRLLSLSKNKYMKSLEPTEFVDFFGKFPRLTAVDCSPCVFNIKDELLIVITNAIAKLSLPLAEVNIRDCPNVTDHSMWNLATKLPALTALTSSAASLSYVTWQTVAGECKLLTRAELSTALLSSEEVLAFVQRSHSLVHLILHAGGDEMDGFSAASSVLTNDLILEIFQARVGTFQTFVVNTNEQIPSSTFSRILLANPQLMHFALARTSYQVLSTDPCAPAVRVMLRVETQQEDSLVSVFNALPPQPLLPTGIKLPSTLASLYIAPTLAVSTWMLNVIAQRFGPALEEVEMQLTEEVKSGHLIPFLQACPKLEKLKISFSPHCAVDENAGYLQALPQHCPHIISLGLTHNHSLTDEVVVALIEAYGVQLSQLDISHCPAISGAVLSALTVHCQRLRRLDAAGTRISPDCLQGFQRRLDGQQSRPTMRTRRSETIDSLDLDNDSRTGTPQDDPGRLSRKLSSRKPSEMRL